MPPVHPEGCRSLRANPTEIRGALLSHLLSPAPSPLFPLPHPRKSKVGCLGRCLTSQKYRTTGLVDKDKEEGRKNFERTKRPPSEEFNPLLFVQNQMPAGPMQSSPNRIARHKKKPKRFFYRKVGKIRFEIIITPLALHFLSSDAPR